MRTHFLMVLLAAFVVAVTVPTSLAPASRAELTGGRGDAGERQSADESGAPGESPDGNEPAHPVDVPLTRQLIPDSHAGGTRVPLNARHMLRLPGWNEMPGLRHHGLGAWLEWQMTRARLAASSMGVVAPTIRPHAPPARS